MKDAKFGVCPTCGVDVTRRTTYQFPEDFGQVANTYVFCSYDCMTSMPKYVVEQKEEKKEEKSAGGWF